MNRNFITYGIGTWLLGIFIFLIYYLILYLYTPEPLPADIQITITATGKKNPNSKSSEVWIISAPGLDMKKKYPGWELRNGHYISYPGYQKQPTTLTWTAKTGASRPIILVKHSYSGIAKINIGEIEYTYDLFSPDKKSKRKEIYIQRMLNNKFGTWRKLLFLTIFLLIFIILSFIYIRITHLRQYSINEYLYIKMQIFIFLSYIMAWHGLTENQKIINESGMLIIYLWYSIIIMLQIMIIYTSSKIIKKKNANWNLFHLRIYDIIIILNLLANFYATYLNSLNHNSLNFIISIIIFILLAITILNLIKNTNAYQALLIFILFFGASIFISSFFKLPGFIINYKNDNSSIAIKNSNKIKDLPNIYFISLDGLYSPQAFKQIIGSKAQQIWSVLNKAGFSVQSGYAPSTTQDIPYCATKSTFYQIFTFNRFDAGGNSFDFLHGRDQNPAIDRLRKAGYKIQAILGARFFGHSRGYWDYYLSGNNTPLNHCWSVYNNFYFYGICSLARYLKIGKYNPYKIFNKLEERVKYAAHSEHPWFTFSHVLLPGHTPLSHRFNDIAKSRSYLYSYLKLVESATPHLKKIFKYITENDKNAIIVFHSDHGAVITRGWTKSKDENGLFSYEQVKLDRCGVPISIYPYNFCSAKLKDIKTTRNLLKEIFGCLGF